MATKFFSNWTDANSYQDLLALESGYAYSTVVDYADALVCQATGEVKNIVITNDAELVAIFREKGYEIGFIDDWEAEDNR
jgi:rRNA-processing protein FCF1